MQGYVSDYFLAGVSAGCLTVMPWCSFPAEENSSLDWWSEGTVTSEIWGVTITCWCEICIKLQQPKQPHPHFQFLCYPNRLLASYLAYRLFFYWVCFHSLCGIHCRKLLMNTSSLHWTEKDDDRNQNFQGTRHQRPVTPVWSQGSAEKLLK